MPNRYSSFGVDVPSVTQRGRVRVRRIVLPAHQSGMLDQSRAFVAFAVGALRLVRREDYAIVYATSSRLMTAVLGGWIAWRKGAQLYLDLRDIFVDTIKDVLSPRVAFFLAPLFARLESWTVRRAARVNLVSPGFADYFFRRYPTKKVMFFTNGIDDEFVQVTSTPAMPPVRTKARPDRVLNVVYAGNIGEGQGLHEVIPELARRLKGRARFRLIGDGGRRRELEARIAEAGLGNVELLAPMDRKSLLLEYEAADVLFIHLNDYDAFRKVLPSKIFEYAATGKPIWAGVAGYAAAFLRDHVDNVALFDPCDADTAVREFGILDMSWHDRAEFIARFSRRAISMALAKDVLSLVATDAS